MNTLFETGQDGGTATTHDWLTPPHQSQLAPEANKFHVGKGTGRHIACFILRAEAA